MAVLLLIFAVFAGALGAVFLTPATSGVGVICGACLAAILARIAQAADHHRQLCTELQKAVEAQKPKPGSYQGEFAPSGKGAAST